MFNERYFYKESLQRLTKIADSSHINKVQIVIVDDCSTDLLEDELESAVAKMPSQIKNTEYIYEIHKHKQNSGKGKAIQTGIKHVTGDITVIHDADLEYDPEDIIKIIDVFASKNADVVYGSRFLPSQYKRVLYFRHELGNKLITFLVDLATDLNLTDVETCYKAIRTPLLKSIPLFSRDFCIEVELTIKLAQREARFYEIPISYNGRTYDEGKKINWKDGIKTLFAIIRYTLTHNNYLEEDYNRKLINKLSRARRYNRYTADIIKPYLGETVLEIGSGTGSITRKLPPKIHYHATDINPLYLHTLKNLKETRPFLDVSYLDIEHLCKNSDLNKSDSIICINIAEHAENDIQILKNINSLLKPGGTAIVLVPNSPFLYSRLDKALGHKRRYNKKTLKELGEASGFNTHKILCFNRLGSIAWLFSAKLLRRRRISQFQIWFMNLITPIIKITDKIPVVPPLSLIGIFKKPEKDK